jgi:DHA2 family multidrug resistance protein-like MFS transporter
MTTSSAPQQDRTRSKTAPARPPAPARGTWRDWLALGLLMFPVLLVAVDNTALTFALPAIARALGTTGVELLWIVDAYPLVLAGLLVAMGSLGDRIGRRRLLVIGSIGFAAVSAATAFAPSAGWLIAGRAALGFFGAMLMPSTLSLIRNIFPDPNRRRLAIAIWAAGFSGGAALGPIFGGWLVEHFWWGAVLLVAMGAAFVRRQLRLGSPLLDMSLFRNRVFSMAITANILALFSFNGFILFLAQHLQLLEGMSPSAAGMAMIPALVATVAAGLAVVPLVRKIRPGFVVAAGLGLSAAGYSLVTFGNHDNGPALLLAALLVLALGVGTAETISNDLILGSVPAEKSGAASAISETGYEVGALLGTAVLGSILTASYQHNLRLPAGLPGAASGEGTAHAGETLAGAMELAAGLPAPLADAVRQAAGAAFDSGVHVTAAIGLVLMATAAVLAAVVLRKVPKAG